MAKLLGEECNLFCVPWLLVEGYFWEFMFSTSFFSTKTRLSFVLIRQYSSAFYTYVKNNVHPCPIFRFQEMDIPENPHLAPHIRYLHVVYTG